MGRVRARTPLLEDIDQARTRAGQAVAQREDEKLGELDGPVAIDVHVLKARPHHFCGLHAHLALAHKRAELRRACATDASSG